MEIVTNGELKGKRLLIGGKGRKSPICIFHCILMVFNSVTSWPFSHFILIRNPAGVEAGKDRKSSYHSQPRQQSRASGS